MLKESCRRHDITCNKGRTEGRQGGVISASLCTLGWQKRGKAGQLDITTYATFACDVLSSDSSRGMSCTAFPGAAAFTRHVALHPAKASRALDAAGPFCFESGRLRCRASTWRLASCHRPADDMHSSSSRLNLTCIQKARWVTKPVTSNKPTCTQTVQPTVPLPQRCVLPWQERGVEY